MSEIVALESGRDVYVDAEVIEVLEELMAKAKSGIGIRGFAYAIIEGAREDCTTSWVGGGYSNFGLAYGITRLHQRFWHVDITR